MFKCDWIVLIGSILDSGRVEGLCIRPCAPRYDLIGFHISCATLQQTIAVLRTPHNIISTSTTEIVVQMSHPLLLKLLVPIFSYNIQFVIILIISGLALKLVSSESSQLRRRRLRAFIHILHYHPRVLKVMMTCVIIWDLTNWSTSLAAISAADVDDSDTFAWYATVISISN